MQLDLTYRCNERCVHCYLDHDDRGEMTTTEIKSLLQEMADAGVFILTLSGGEILLRRDFFEILEHARKLTFCVKLKTNAILIGDREAERIRSLGVESLQVSIYSHRPEVHDAITKVPGSLNRSLAAIRCLKAPSATPAFPAQDWTKAFSIRCLAVLGTRLVMFLLMATSTLACNSPCPVATFATNGFSISGATPINSTKCGASVYAT